MPGVQYRESIRSRSVFRVQVSKLEGWTDGRLNSEAEGNP
jgi:hypothetical protein